MIRVLQAESTVDVQAYLKPREFQNNHLAHRRRSRKGQKEQSQGVTMSVIVYGTMDTFDDIGEFFYHCSEYLQAPIHCDRDVPYRNPQSLSGRDENPPTTFGLRGEISLSEIETLTHGADPSAVLETAFLYPESDPPAAVRTPLYR